MPFSPLTLTLSPKRRGKINFDNTAREVGRDFMKTFSKR
jgi:hypothetical protein